MEPIDGFWLPANLRQQVLRPDTGYRVLSFDRGRPAEPGDAGAVTARWPVLDAAAWRRLLAGLRANRQHGDVPGPAFWDRFRAALEPVARRFADPGDPLHARALAALPGYTGYSEGMIRASLGGLAMWHLDPVPAAFALEPTVADGWQTMPGLPGRLRFYPAVGAEGARSPWARAGRWLRALGGGGSTAQGAPVFAPRDQWPPLDLVAGFGAGNVPGTALMIVFLALATSLAGGAPPVVVVRNSRREPILAPLLLGALEEVDPDLVATVAVLVWAHDDATAAQELLPGAGLVLAAAGDEAIAEIGAAVRRAAAHRPRDGGYEPGGEPPSPTRSNRPRDGGYEPGEEPPSLTRSEPPSRGRSRRSPARFHAHGHKVSFGAIAREVLLRGQEVDGVDLVDVVTLLAALDSAFWDQHGCLSTRVLFVEEGPAGEYHTVAEVAARLADKLALLAGVLPRGAWPRRHLHDQFDHYKLLEQGRGYSAEGRGYSAGQVQVLTGYDDEFLVVVDAREEIGGAGFPGVVNGCQGRAVVVRPVADLMEIPRRYLSQLPAGQLQSLSVAAGRPRDRGSERGMDERFLAFAEACGARGVTAIRTVGRGAFPQLAYSWDGLIPLDLVAPRAPGRFTTVEFDDPAQNAAQMLETYALFVEAGLNH